MSHLTLEDVIGEALDSLRGEIHTQIPATLTSYDHATQTGTISYDIRGLWVDPETDEETWVSLPDQSGVPVIHYPGVISDLEDGIKGLALICERDIDAWKGGSGGDVTPADRRKFNLNDVVFVPGLSQTSRGDAREGATVIPGASIRLGNPDATARVVREDKMRSENADLRARVARLEFLVRALVAIPTITAGVAPLVAGAPATIAAGASAVQLLDTLTVPVQEAERAAAATADLGAETTTVE